jgi:hypothetical protein
MRGRRSRSAQCPRCGCSHKRSHKSTHLAPNEKVGRMFKGIGAALAGRPHSLTGFYKTIYTCSECGHQWSRHDRQGRFISVLDRLPAVGTGRKSNKATHRGSAGVETYSESSSITFPANVQNRGHLVFRDKFALAVLRTAFNPHACANEMTGSYAALRSALKDLRGGLKTLSDMTKPRSQGGLGRIDVHNDTWTFTASGVSEYSSHLAWARRYIAES